MSNKADIVIRFSIVSENSIPESNIGEVLSFLPKPESIYIIGKERILTNKKTIINKETSINYLFNCSTYEIEDCDKLFLEQWHFYTDALRKIAKNQQYKFFLNYEVTVYNLDYPAFVFYPDFIAFVADLNINFSMYFYND